MNIDCVAGAVAGVVYKETESKWPHKPVHSLNAANSKPDAESGIE